MRTICCCFQHVTMISGLRKINFYVKWKSISWYSPVRKSNTATSIMSSNRRPLLYGGVLRTSSQKFSCVFQGGSYLVLSRPEPTGSARSSADRVLAVRRRSAGKWPPSLRWRQDFRRRRGDYHSNTCIHRRNRCFRLKRGTHMGMEHVITWTNIA